MPHPAPGATALEPPSWPVQTTTSQIAHEEIEALVSGELAAIRTPGFTDPAACAAIVDAAQEHGYEWYQNVLPPIGKIGVVQIEHKTPEATREYFAKGPPAVAARDAILGAGGDPFARLLELLGDAWPAGARVAREESLGADYFAGVIRNMTAARLHVDWAPRDARDWSIGSIAGQLAWNIYLKIGHGTGQTRVYDRWWSEELEEFKTQGNYGYEPQAVEGARFVQIQPHVGDLVIFSPRHFHEVICPDDGQERIALGSFGGVTTTDEPLVLWS
jgi:hypothetical protein